MQQNIVRWQPFVTGHGERGRRVFRYEWRAYKRVLRPSLRKRWVPCQFSTKLFFDRLYRLDPEAVDNWSSIVKSSGGDTAPAPKYSTFQLLQLEYVRGVFVKYGVYGFPGAPGEETAPRDADDRHFLQPTQVLGVHTTQSRPKVVPTHQTRTGGEQHLASL